jgi:hypothetical protein
VDKGDARALELAVARVRVWVQAFGGSELWVAGGGLP